MWCIGIIAYILLRGSRPVWAHSKSGTFQAILKVGLCFVEAPCTLLSSDAVDFVKRLLDKDYGKRLTAVQALGHPWLSDHWDIKIPLDMIIYGQVKAVVCSSSL
ncbi:hypothetical protein Nepgr_022046 [Nepenthes gracilis]|uniref:Protein kinase domain-containing protein n=1 Tax=Nepenthes gracilis TaxID=150966 RepID=A0AAD3XXT1_NEPGR|nr:hypothetical protein Nepgr_022046 [Nepenthes gracilis]